MGLRGEQVTHIMETAVKDAEKAIEARDLRGTDASIEMLVHRLGGLQESVLMLARVIDRLETQPRRSGDDEDAVSEDHSSTA